MTCISDTNEDSREIPTNCVVSDNIIDSAFNDLTSDITKRIILAPKNDASLLLTKQALDRLPAEQCIYLTVDQAICDKKEEQQNYSIEFINSLTLSGMPEHRLCLKVGSIIVLLRNLDIQSDVCNRTRLTVKLLYENIVVAETISVNKKTILIPQIQLVSSDVNLPFVLQCRQFMTINKAQDQTFDKLGIHLPAPVFSHGKLYVAFSRVKSFKDIYVNICKTTTQSRRHTV